MAEDSTHLKCSEQSEPDMAAGNVQGADTFVGSQVQIEGSFDKLCVDKSTWLSSPLVILSEE